MKLLPLPPKAAKEECEAVEIIKSLPISILCCVDLLLLYKGFKKAVDVVVFTEEENQLKMVRRNFSSLGFFFTETKKAKYPKFYLAKTEKLAREMRYVYENEGNDKRLGELSGFPESAINAYVYCVDRGFEQNESHYLINDQKHLPKDILFRDYMIFAQFRLSQKHWLEEIDTPRRWASEIWRIAPDIYLYFMEVRSNAKLSKI